MKHLREITSISSSMLERFDRITRMRLAATEALNWFEQLRLVAVKQREAVNAARSVEKIVFRYARWLGWYRSTDGATAILVRELKASPIHKDAVASILYCQAAVAEIITSPHPWISLPNHENTKFNALRMLDSAVGNFDVVISKLRQLQGHDAEEGSAT